jgi:hypothetical protein
MIKYFSTNQHTISFLEINNIIRTTYSITTLLAICLLSASLSFGADVGGTLTVDVPPTTPIVPLLRGRPYIANGTLLADNGSILRCIHSHTIPNTFFRKFNQDPNWWRNLRDVGHFNCVRGAGYLGDWFKTKQPTTLAQQIATFDGMVAAASQSGMYLIIDEHSGTTIATGRTDWAKNHTFWQAMAPRYANNPNVIYELKNEPDYTTRSNGQTLAQNEIDSHKIIRSAAPNTIIIMNSLACPTFDVGEAGVISLLQTEQAGGVDFSKAVAGYHAYCDSSAALDSLAFAMRGAGFPIFMTEYTVDSTVPNPQFGFEYLSGTLESKRISWSWLDCTGFVDAASGTTYGPCAKVPIHITYPQN